MALVSIQGVVYTILKVYENYILCTNGLYKTCFSKEEFDETDDEMLKLKKVARIGGS